MQKLALFAVAFCVVGVALAKPVEKDQHPFDRLTNECRAELGISPPSGENAVGSVAKDGRLLLCLNQKLGIMDSKGNIDANGLRKVISEMGLPESSVNEIVERCGKQTSDKAEENAIELFRCIHKDV